MVSFYFAGETHTLASALRPLLERAHPEEYVACTHQHPLDDFVRVDAPDAHALRTALLSLKEQIASARHDLAMSKSSRVDVSGANGVAPMGD